jgi:hypothetical protein
MPQTTSLLQLLVKAFIIINIILFFILISFIFVSFIRFSIAFRAIHELVIHTVVQFRIIVDLILSILVSAPCSKSYNCFLVDHGSMLLESREKFTIITHT